MEDEVKDENKTKDTGGGDIPEWGKKLQETMSKILTKIEESPKPKDTVEIPVPPELEPEPEPEPEPELPKTPLWKWLF